MIKNPFRKDPPPTPTEDPIVTLQNQINQLQKEEHTLHAKIMSEANIIEKRKLVARHSKIIERINALKTQQHDPLETQASQATNKLFKEKLYVLELNDHKTKPDNDLNIALRFYPCSHKKTIHIKNLIHPKPNSEQALLSHWQAIFNANTELTGSFNCQECRRAKQKRLREEHRYSDKDRIGTCRFMLKVV